MKPEQRTASLSVIFAIVGAVLALFLLKNILSFLLNHWIFVLVIALVFVLGALFLVVRDDAK
jgi:preprotein translocase subunit SecY